MAARGIDTASARFSTSFGAGLDYTPASNRAAISKDKAAEPL